MGNKNMLTESLRSGISRYWRRLGCVIGCACLIPLLYQVENWRGKRAWEGYKRESEAKGAMLDWQKFTPPPVADELNVFCAPMMAHWFGDRENQEFAQHMCLAPPDAGPQRGDEILAEIRVVSFGDEVCPDEYDVLLEYRHPDFSAGLETPQLQCEEEPPVIPLIVMDDVPLSDAIRNLSRQAGIRYVLDREVDAQWFGPYGEALPQPVVTIRWENVTARQGMLALLYNYNLEMVEKPKSLAVMIRYRNSNASRVFVDNEARKQLRRALARCSAGTLDDPGVQKLHASTGGFVLFCDTAGKARSVSSPPAHVVIRADARVSPDTLQSLMRIAATGTLPEPLRLRVSSAECDSYRVFRSPTRFCGAGYYLARTALFEKHFDIIRKALERPMSRLAGDYSCITNPPSPNYVSLRVVAQTLNQRAQADLLLNRPADAVRELRLALDMCKMLENKPSGTPVTLVSAMIRVAIVGLCVGTIEAGFNLKKWTTSELSELKQMLAEIRLEPLVSGALNRERAAHCRLMETASPEEFARMLSFEALTNPSSWDKHTSPAYWFLTLAPRGWVYQNMITIAALHEPLLQTYDHRTGLVHPEAMTSGIRMPQDNRTRFHPYKMLAFLAVPNVVRAWATTAKNQSDVNHAFLACALEHYHQVHGSYPEQLEELVPQFAANIPHDVITGSPPRYRLEPSGEFLLYSVGWDRQDNGGKTSNPDGPPVETGSDWVWAASSKD